MKCIFKYIFKTYIKMLFLKYIYECQNRPVEVSTVPFPKQVLKVIEQMWKAASPKNFIFLLSLKRLLKHNEQGAATQTPVETSSQARKQTDATPPEVSLYLFVLVMRVFCLFFLFFLWWEDLTGDLQRRLSQVLDILKFFWILTHSLKI